jgi:hypothetical protein
MSGRLRSRLERLERQAQSGLVPLPPLFWEGGSRRPSRPAAPRDAAEGCGAIRERGRRPGPHRGQDCRRNPFSDRPLYDMRVCPARLQGTLQQQETANGLRGAPSSTYC